MRTIKQITPELQELAILNLNEDPKRTEKDILAIKEWLKKQPHLTCRTDDEWILSFLRCCKFSLERTKEKIDSCLTLKALSPEFYTNRDPMAPELQEIFKAGIFVHLNTADAFGRALMLYRVSQMNPKKHDTINTFKSCFIHLDVTSLETDRFCISGVTIVVDCKGLSSDHILKYANPSILKKGLTCELNCFPYQTQAIIFINVPSAFEYIGSMLQSWTDHPYQFYGNDLAEFYKQVPLSALPNEYGGDAGPIDELAAEWKKKVENHRSWLIEDEKYKADEKKRKGRAKTASEIFGMEGSFRTLSLD